MNEFGFGFVWQNLEVFLSVKLIIEVATGSLFLARLTTTDDCTKCVFVFHVRVETKFIPTSSSVFGSAVKVNLIITEKAYPKDSPGYFSDAKPRYRCFF